jgi:hypothetical protein
MDDPRYEGGDRSQFTKSLTMLKGKAEAMPVEMPKWDRLKRRVEALEKAWSLNWLAGGASSAFTTAIGAAIAALALPSGHNSGISPTVAPVLWVITGVGLALAAAFGYLAKVAHDERKGKGADIVNEMETEEASWERERARDLEVQEP